MPNVSRPNGFRPVKHMDGSAWNGQLEKFAVLASDATALYTGDLVKLSGAADASGLAAVTRIVTAATDVPVGVVVGFEVDYSSPNSPGAFRAASTARYALVCVDPSVVYEAQASGAYGIATDAGLNAAPTVTAGSATTGVSGMQVDLATKATTATLPLKILGLVQRVDNDLTDTSNMKVHVVINSHALNGGVAGV